MNNKLTPVVAIFAILAAGVLVYVVITKNREESVNLPPAPPPTPNPTQNSSVPIPTDQPLSTFEGVLKVVYGDDFVNKRVYYYYALETHERGYPIDLSNIGGTLGGPEHLHLQNKPVKVMGYFDGQKIIIQSIELRNE
jgi:hypothetical protein